MNHFMSKKSWKKLPGWFPLPGSLMQNIETNKTFVVIDLIRPASLTKKSRYGTDESCWLDSTWKIKITDELDQAQQKDLFLTRSLREGWRTISGPPR